MTAATTDFVEQASDPHVTRLTSPGLEVALQQFANPEVLAAGKVNVISLEAVMERFGKRWSLRREQVHEHVQITLDRQLGSQGYHLRISDTDVLVCQPHLARLSGQAFCLRMLRDILNHFLGQGEQADIGVLEVRRVSSNGIEATPVDAGAAYAAEATGTPRGAPQAKKPPTVGSVDIWTPFVASDGRNVEVSCALDTVRELRSDRVIGLRLSRRVIEAGSGIELSPSELAGLSRSDRLRIDLGSTVQGFNLLRGRKTGPEPLALIVPVSFSSLSNLDGRARIVSAFKEARSYAAQGVICELSEIDGVPATTLLSAASMIRPFSLFVIGHISELSGSIGLPFKEAGLRGVSMACPQYLADTGFIDWLKTVVPSARKAANSVLLYRLPSARSVQLARRLGATHASLGP